MVYKYVYMYILFLSGHIHEYRPAKSWSFTDFVTCSRCDEPLLKLLGAGKLDPDAWAVQPDSIYALLEHDPQAVEKEQNTPRAHK